MNGLYGTSGTTRDEDSKWEREKRRRLDKMQRDRKGWDEEDEDDELRSSRKWRRRKKHEWVE